MKSLLELAKQAGVAVQVQTGRVGGGWDTSYVITPDLERFAHLVRAQALEEAINIIEEYRIPVGNSAAGEMACEWTYDALHRIRDDIRAMKEQT